MYTPAFFAISDADECLELAAARGFGVVVAVLGDVVEATHVPFVLDRADGVARLRFHVAVANGLHRMVAGGARLLCIVSGPDAYVSPDWYATADLVPTWNYLAVHLRGPGRILDAGELRAQVETLSAASEARLAPKRPWSSAKMTPRKFDAMLKAIVGIEMTVEAVEGKAKLSQDKSATDRVGVVEALRARGDPSGAAVAELMQTGA